MRKKEQKRQVRLWLPDGSPINRDLSTDVGGGVQH